MIKSANSVSPFDIDRERAVARKYAVRTSLSDVVIEKNIPIPSGRGSSKSRILLALMLKLKAGDSVRLDDVSAATISSVLTKARKETGGEFVRRKLVDDRGEYFRVWRVVGDE